MSERVLAEVTGSVWKIMVQEGQDVVPEQTLVILESMKMEIPCAAAGAGTIAQILVSEGDSVAEGQHLLTIE
jgi:biotin carboxyl carrier protein